MKTLIAKMRFGRMIDLARASRCRRPSMCVPLPFERLKPLDPPSPMPAGK